MSAKHSLSCYKCGSSDGVSLYHDGAWCFVCETRFDKDEYCKESNIILTNTNTPKEATVSNLTVIPSSFLPLKDRGISKEAAEKYKITYIENVENPYVHIYPYTRKGKHVSNKKRTRKEKSFRWENKQDKLDLFGQSAFPAGSARQLTIVEGECDALAVYDMNNGFPVVSVSSAGSAVKDCRTNYEYINSFDTIVLCFDKDEAKIKPDGTRHFPGQEAALRVAEMFPMGKVRILTLSEHKDPNDYLRAGKQKKFIKEWWDAPIFIPSGLVMGRDLWNDVINPPEYETIAYPFQGLNDKTYGLRLSEFVILHAQPKIGKTTVIKEVAKHIFENTEDTNLGFMLLEEPKRDTAIGLMSLVANKRLHLPDVWEAEKEADLKRYFDKIVNTDRIIIWDHFGSNSIDAVLDKMRHMHALGCKYIFLDHISIIVSSQDGDERKQLDEIATKIKQLCMELNICVIAVVHENREGKIRGTLGLEQLANMVIQLERDKLAPSSFIRNCIKLTVKENRFCGETGLACYLWYDPSTGRLVEYSEEEYTEAANSNSVTEAPWN